MCVAFLTLSGSRRWYGPDRHKCELGNPIEDPRLDRPNRGPSLTPSTAYCFTTRISRTPARVNTVTISATFSAGTSTL